MRAARLFAAVILIASTAVLVRAASRPSAARRVDLGALPFRFDTWRGRDAEPLDAETMRILAADAYVNRNYVGGESPAPVNFYVAYYAEQRPGVSIHSPLHCLPGTGWEPLDVSTLEQPFGPQRSGQMRRMLIRKNRERALVLYWYAIHGRMLANEVVSKFVLLHDALRLGESDAALVRIVVPVGAAGDTSAAEGRGVAFARDVLPYLQRLWS